MINRVKGTQDFLDLTLFNLIINEIRQQLTLHDFSQIELPILEPIDLFKRTVGEQTDIVSKEMFVIAPKNESGEAICLRPEATAQTMRAFLENGIQIIPWKVFSFGPLFRYERPQKGRFRQFYQANIEVIGIQAIEQDVLVIAMLDQLFSQKFQLKNYGLVLNFLGCANDRAIFRDILKKFLQDSIEICETCQKRAISNPLRIFDCKNTTCQAIYEQAPRISDHLCQACNSEWITLQKDLELLGVSFTHNPKLVRGLDYYNKTVFEFTSTDLGAQSAFCGGGRYELATQLGHRDEITSIGAAIGLERIMMLLETHTHELPIPKKQALVAVIPVNNSSNILAMLIYQNLYQSKICTDFILDGESIKSKMRKANKLGAIYAILIGENEQHNQTATIKDMLTGNEETIAQSQVAAYLKNKGL